ncbi:MAG: methyltransferase [Parvibaculaceae bacterium]|nr:methyltransferase [Parvibaculaceae bacterium]
MTLESAAGTGWTEDGFLGGRLSIRQPRAGYRAGVDAVMLAASLPAKAGERVLEAGLGVGVASLCLASRVPGLRMTGIEIQPDLAEAARANAARNGLSGLEVMVGDLRGPMKDWAAQGLLPGIFDHVFSNPPYFDHESHALPPDGGKAVAHAMAAGGLEGWVRFCSVMARPGGSVTFVHRSEALPELLGEMGKLLGGIGIFPLWPREGAPAGRVLARGVRGSRAPFRLHRGLVLHGEGNSFTPAAEAVLRAGAALPFS